MNDYYIRCRAAEVAQLYALALSLGVLSQAKDGSYSIAAPHTGAWDEVGPINRPTGDVDAQGHAITSPLLDDAGAPYWHANLRINASLADIAHAKAATSPAIAAGLANLARWFVVGVDGKATAPKQPERVWL